STSTHPITVLSPSFSLPLRPPPASTLFPYTTLFRSRARRLSHTLTEPVLAPVRRVLPPVRIGSVSLDLAFTVVQARSSDTEPIRDRKSTRLNSSHVAISYAVFCLKKKN